MASDGDDVLIAGVNLRPHTAACVWQLRRMRYPMLINSNAEAAATKCALAMLASSGPLSWNKSAKKTMETLNALLPYTFPMTMP